MGEARRDDVSNNIEVQSKGDGNNDNEESEKLPYPKTVFVIVLNEFWERYSYFGLRTLLTIYLVNQLTYTDSEATVIYHSVSFLGTASPIIGSIIADSWLGKFKTICYFSIVYMLGYVLLSVSAIMELDVPHRELTIVGLAILACGGGIFKPSIMPLGADQFVLPQQQKQLKDYYGIFYFLITFGGLISSLISPVLRKHVSCFGNDCYPFAFGLPALLMLSSVVLLVFFRKSIKVIPPEDDLIVKVFKCIGYAIKAKLKRNTPKRDHWLDHAQEKYGKKMVAQLKMVFKVFYMFTPIPIYWALIDQIATAWILMARKMDGNLGFYTLDADQITFAGTIMYITIIPLVQFVMVPLAEKCGVMRTTLQKMIIAGFFVAISFICAAGISYKVEGVKYVLPNAGEAQIRIYNTLPCDVTITCAGIEENLFTIEKGAFYVNTDIKTQGANQTYSFHLESSCVNINGNFSLYDQGTVGYYFKEDEAIFIVDEIEPEELLTPLIRALVNPNGFGESDTISIINSKDKVEFENTITNITLNALSIGTYTIQIGETEHTETLYLGGIYSILAIQTAPSTYDVSVVEVTPPESMHMLWILPPAGVMDIGITLFTVAGLEFGYSQAPASMKTVIMGGWILTNAFGNLIVVILQTTGLFDKQYKDFLLYSGILVVDILVYIWMAVKYKYVTPEEVAAVTNME